MIDWRKYEEWLKNQKGIYIMGFRVYQSEDSSPIIYRFYRFDMFNGWTMRVSEWWEG